MQSDYIATLTILQCCQQKASLGFCDVTMMLLHSQSISYFNVKHTIWLKGYQNGNYIEQWTGNPKGAGLNPAQGQFFTMLISCSRGSDVISCSRGSNGSMWLPFW